MICPLKISYNNILRYEFFNALAYLAMYPHHHEAKNMGGHTFENFVNLISFFQGGKLALLHTHCQV